MGFIAFQPGRRVFRLAILGEFNDQKNFSDCSEFRLSPPFGFTLNWQIHPKTNGHWIR